MNDKELLRLAAKAAGFDGEYDDELEDFVINKSDECGFFFEDWNPLTDDGDALRLAVRLGITDLSMAVGKLVLVEDMNLTGVAVVRRAIVRAAADVGKGLLTQDEFEAMFSDRFDAEIGKSL